MEVTDLEKRIIDEFAEGTLHYCHGCYSTRKVIERTFEQEKTGVKVMYILYDCNCVREYLIGFNVSGNS